MYEATRSAVVIKSALELIRGLTKLSGSHPILKVIKVADNAIVPTIKKERTFVRIKSARIFQ